MTHGDQNKEILTDSDWNRDTTNNTFSNRDTIYNDSPKDMTYSRRIARYLSRYHCYFPQHVRKDEEGGGEYPKLDMAWAHFEHFVLPRCFREKNHVENNIRAGPGEIEEDTMLYAICGTTLTHMAEFGVGVGLYFSTVKFFAIMTFIAGIINIPAMIYFASDEYSPDGRQNIENLLKVSAVCTQTKLKPCPNCRESDWAGRFPSDSKDRFAVGKASDGSELAFIKVNDCNIDGFFGISTYACLVFVVLAVFVFLHRQKIKAVKFDDAMQTSTDYSIKIMNPPPDAKDPDSWKEFFESEETKFDATVNLCTIVIDNHPFIKALVDRRRCIAALNDLLPLGTKFDEENLEEMVETCQDVPAWKRVICCAKTPKRLVADIRQKEDRIIAFAQDSNPNFEVKRVFVTFDTMTSKQNVMEKLCIPLLRIDKLPEYQRYEGKALVIVEPDEPISIRWSDLSHTLAYQIMQRISTMFLSMCLIMGAFFLSTWSNAQGPQVAAIVIVVTNSLVPLLVRILTSLESHPDESSMTASKYIKITLFRWSNTVIIPFLLVPFANTLDDDKIIKNIQVLFIAELTYRPVLQILDIFGNISRHILGPHAVDQRRMNLMFSGDSYDIGERYTDITRMLFLTLFSSVLYPMSFFFTSAIFAIYYWIDKFSLLRSWKQESPLGTAVSTISMIFFNFCVLTYGIMAAYMYAHFPYDNACPFDVDISKYEGSFNVTFLDNSSEMIQIQDVTKIQGYKFCNQEMIRNGAFPPVPERQSDGKWMTKAQEDFLSIFGWTSVAILALVLTLIFTWFIKRFIFPLFYKSYKDYGEVMSQRFEDVKEIHAYIPQQRIPGYVFPFLTCKTDNIYIDHVGWNDPKEDGYDKHSLINDLKSIIHRYNVECDADIIDSLFSTVKNFVDRDGVRSSERMLGKNL